MKKISLLFLISILFSNVSFSQKTKATPKTSPKVVGLAVLDNLVVDTKDNVVYVVIKAQSNQEIITLSDQKFINTPEEIKIKSFTSDNTKLYLINWIEITTNKTELKLEEIKTIYSKIINPETKAILFSNYQKTNHITEKVFLDKLKNASESQQKIRREGFEFILNPDGSITQKNKSQENKWVFKASEAKFVDVKRK